MAIKVERVVPISLDTASAIAYAQAAAEENSQVGIEKTEYLGGGMFGRAVGITFADGSAAVVKLLLSSDMLDKEVYDLRLLGQHCTVKIPKVIFVRKADKKIPIDCYAMERIPGRNVFLSLKWALASKKKRLAFADKVTSALRAIHECKSQKFGDTLDPAHGDWLDFYKPFAKAVLDKAEELHTQAQLSRKIIEVMRDAWDKFDGIFAQKVEDACLIHGDLNVANIMADKCGLTGFIDPLNSMYADREYDLFQFNNLTGKRFYLCDTYVKKYGASQNYRQKLAFYGLWNEVYCYIKSGILVGVIMNPLVKNMRRQLKSFP